MSYILLTTVRTMQFSYI